MDLKNEIQLKQMREPKMQTNIAEVMVLNQTPSTPITRPWPMP